jgi:hypothetical protein
MQVAPDPDYDDAVATRAPVRSRRRLLRAGALLVAAFVFVLLPSRISGHQASAWFAGDPDLALALARGTAHDTERLATARRFATGSPRFDSEWHFGSFMMAAMGHGQVALAHPSEAREQHALMARSLERLLEPELRVFDSEAWHDDALAALDGDQGHAAYLGYLGVALGLEARVLAREPSLDDEAAEKRAALRGHIARALRRRLENSATLLLETYPGERYPVDNSAVVAAIALDAESRGEARPEIVTRWVSEVRARYIDRESGLLYQSTSPSGAPSSLRTHADGAPLDRARGSGTALASYFLSFADAPLSRDLYQALKGELYVGGAGFGAMREYPMFEDGRGDIDSGPLLFGLSVSATGFGLAAARIHGDGDTFARMFATTHLFGAPIEQGGVLRFASGGPIGNAILFAMLTAAPLSAGGES